MARDRVVLKGIAVLFCLLCAGNVFPQYYQYDSLKIVVWGAEASDGYEVVDGIVMRSDQDTTLMAMGLRSDNGLWEIADAVWVADGVPVELFSPQNSLWCALSPTASGNGSITASAELAFDTLRVTIPVVFEKGVPANVVIYPEAGNVEAQTPYGNEPFSVIAGEEIPLVVKVFDCNGEWLDVYETGSGNDAFSWRFDPDEAAIAGSGHSVRCVVSKAHQTIRGIAAFRDNGMPSALYDTVFLDIVPAEAAFLIIEGEQNTGAVSPNTENPVDTVLLTAVDAGSAVYAVLRDRFGNYAGPAADAEWISLNTLIASIESGEPGSGQGIITRGPEFEGTTMCVASSDEAMLTVRADSVVVVAGAFYFDSLRIADTDGVPLEPLTMFTDDEIVLYAYGRRGDNALWMPVAARWSSSEDVRSVFELPYRAASCVFSPVSPSTGWIAASLQSDGEQVADSIPVLVMRSPPSMVELDIATPAAERIAGETLAVVIRLYNDDGLLPGEFCSDAPVFTLVTVDDDSLSRTMLVVEDSLYAFDGTDGVAVSGQCFIDGIDTVRLLFQCAGTAYNFRAEYGMPAGETGNFSVMPGPQYALNIETPDGASPDTLHLYAPDGAFVFSVRSYDAYGNPRGTVPANWTATGTLHEINNAQNVGRIFYDARLVELPEQGYIIARSADSDAADSVYVVITGSPIQMVEAITRDRDGNGYIDAIELHFSGPCRVDEEDYVKFRAEYQSLPLDVESVSGINGTPEDSVFMLGLAEYRIDGPQSAWKPYVSFSGIMGIEDVAPGMILCHDGAGPVIVNARVVVENPCDRSMDRVRITFSEVVYDLSGAHLSLLSKPEDFFVAGRITTAGDTLYDSFFEGIESFLSVEWAAISFYMTNGNLFTDSHFIVPKETMPIFDGSMNAAPENASRVPVSVDGLSDEFRCGGDEDDKLPGPDCGCGSGTGLAFIPVIGLRVLSVFRRRARKKVRGAHHAGGTGSGRH